MSGAIADPRIDVAQVIHDFTYHLDQRDYARVAELFTEDGVWVRGGTPCIGPAGIVAALEQRPATLRTRHLSSNLAIRLNADGTAHARYCLTVYDGESDGEGVPTLALPHAIFVCEDDLIETGQGWRFTRRRPRMAFKR